MPTPSDDHPLIPFLDLAVPMALLDLQALSPIPPIRPIPLNPA